MEVNFRIQGVKAPWFNTMILEDVRGNEIIIDRNTTEYTCHEEEDGSFILNMAWGGCYFWDGDKEKYPASFEDFEKIEGAILKELEVEDDAPEGYEPEVLSIEIWAGPVHELVLSLVNSYEICAEEVDENGNCKNSREIESFGNLKGAQAWSRTHLKKYLEEGEVGAIRHYQYFVDSRGNESKEHLVMVYKVEEEPAKRVFTIDYSETYTGQYQVEASSFEEAKELLKEMIMNGDVDGPENCVGSQYEEVTAYN